MNEFIFKNTNSNTKNIMVNELPSIVKAPMRTETIEIDGRDGCIIIDKGYSSYVKTVNITTRPETDLEDLFEWLNGYGEAIFSNEPNRVYKANIINQIELKRLLKFRTATIEFLVQPYKYDIQNNKTAKSNPSTIINEGSVISLPLFVINGTGSCILTINNKNIELNIDTKLIIDTENYRVLDKDGALAGNRMVGEFPTLRVGENTISWTGNFTVEVVKNQKWL